MRFLYNSRNKTIRELKSGSEHIDLTVTESKLIEVLSNGQVNSWKEISKYVYDFYDTYSWYNLKTLKCRLLQKIKLDIKPIQSKGLILKDEIYIL